MKFYKYFIIALFFIVSSCSNSDNNTIPPVEDEIKELTIFHINDQHGSINNFSKIKHIIDTEKQKTNVLFVCGGDLFSGNPVVDFHEEKGFPMIDLMNKTGVDVSVIGNHEFDYGQEVLKNRINQSQFDWICANVNMNATGVPEPLDYVTKTINGLKITFLGLVETNGSENEIIPSTHPWRVQNISFTKHNEVLPNFANLKEQENADLLIALTHLGRGADVNIANNYPYFDIIIGGHSHSQADDKINGTHIYQAGSNLNFIGKIEISLKNKEIQSINYELIKLSNYNNEDLELKALINSYNVSSDLDEVIGYAEKEHSKSQTGYFYTDALRNRMNVDLTFQNTGGVRYTLNKGDITKREIYTIDPFNNGTVVYTMAIGDIKTFLKETKQGFYYSGLKIEQDRDEIEIRNSNNYLLEDNQTITVGINDYIPAVYSNYFTQTPTILELSTAETIIEFLRNTSDPINYTNYNNYFKYQ